MKLFQLHFSAAKNYFFGFATSGVILFSSYYYLNSKPQDPTNSATENINFLKAETPVLKAFNPNDLDENGWKALGFTPNKINTILKYKDIVGGSFKSKAQLKKCYAISAEKFSELEPFILLPENSAATPRKYQQNYSGNYQNYDSKSRNKSLKILGKFNPDNFSEGDFEKMGFTERQAASILKYKNYLGGSFISKEKFKACFIISEENYDKMEPYLLLPETAPEISRSASNFYAKKTEKISIPYQNFDPNTTDFNGWKNLGFSDKQAQVILNYRDRNLKGSFKSLDDIEKCFVISPEKFNELKSFITLNPENFKTKNISKNEPGFSAESRSSISEIKTDFSKIDLNKITYKQLIEYGFAGKSAAMILGFRKKLGGFVNKQQLIDTYDIEKDLAQNLVSIAFLNASEVEKYTLADAPEDWLHNHPYFKYSADRIIYYRQTNPEDKKIWKLLRTKPEYAEKMKLYLK